MATAATAIWRVRTGGSNVNGGGYDPGIAGAATDYSQQDAAQASGTLGTAAGTTAFSDAGGAFTSAMVGNALWIASGAGFTAGPYWITGFTSSTAITLDRSPGTGSVAVWKVGGAHADPWLNYTTTVGGVVPGNMVYIRGGGTDNPASPDYTRTGSIAIVAGTVAAGYVRMIGENGRPHLRGNGRMWSGVTWNYFENLLISCSAATSGSSGVIGGNSSVLINVAIDQNGFDVICYLGTGLMISCECYSSSSNAGAAGTNAAIKTGSRGMIVDGCNIHDAWGDGILMAGVAETIKNSVIAKCTGNGIVATTPASPTDNSHIVGNTIDGNKGHAITLSATAQLADYSCHGNLITNHSQASKAGINVSAGTTAVNDAVKSFFDFNYFYNNTANYTAISAGAHDDTSNTDPLYTNQTTQDYTLQSTSPVIGKGYPASATYAVPGASPALYATLSPLVPRRKVSPDVENYSDWGAVQRIMATGGGGMIMSRLQAGM